MFLKFLKYLDLNLIIFILIKVFKIIFNNITKNKNYNNNNDFLIN